LRLTVKIVYLIKVNYLIYINYLHSTLHVMAGIRPDIYWTYQHIFKMFSCMLFIVQLSFYLSLLHQKIAFTSWIFFIRGIGKAHTLAGQKKIEQKKSKIFHTLSCDWVLRLRKWSKYFSATCLILKCANMR